MRKDAKTTIINAIKAKEPSFMIPCHNAYSVFLEVINENPQLAILVKEASFTGTIVGGVFHLSYSENVNINEEIVCVDTIQEFHNVLHDAIGKIVGSVTMSVSHRIDVKSAYNGFMNTYQAFYANLMSIKCMSRRLSGRDRTVVHIEFQYRIGRVKLAMMKTDVEKRVKEIANEIFCSAMTDDVKAFVAHNYLASHVEYWDNKNANPLEKSYMQSSFGALVNGKCVCQGYAGAYKELLNSQGICCEMVVGTIVESGERHSWNIVKLGNSESFYVDVTWDAQKPIERRYRYFGLKDADLKMDREWSNPLGGICNGVSGLLARIKMQIARNRVEYIRQGINERYLY